MRLEGSSPSHTRCVLYQSGRGNVLVAYRRAHWTRTISPINLRKISPKSFQPSGSSRFRYLRPAIDGPAASAPVT